MPIYEYKCDKCNQRFERLQRLSDPMITICPNCGGAVHKMFSVPALQFKGSGFYVTDYAHRSGGSAPSKPRKASSDATPAKGGKQSD